MYVARLQLSNLGPIGHVDWAPPGDNKAGWHVILGNNGSGKSSLLRALALSIIGSGAVLRWTPSIRSWIRSGSEHADVTATFSATHPETRKTLEALQANYDLHHAARQWLNRSETSRSFIIQESGIALPDVGASYIESHAHRFAASGLGTSRRWVGRDDQGSSAHNNDPLAARFITLLVPGTSLNACIEWIQSLRFESLLAAERGDATSPSQKLLNAVKSVIKALAFDGAALELTDVDSKTVFFSDGLRHHIPEYALSDGVQSLLGIVIEVLRVLASTFETSPAWDRAVAEGVVDLPIVVLIDEIDMHLHALWQRQVGAVLQRVFPAAQFIATSHSPLVCQSDPRSIFRLEQSEGAITGRLVEGEERQRIVNGTIATALATRAFALHGGDRSSEAKKLAARLAALNIKSLHGPLSEAEKQEQRTLEAALPDLAGTLDTAAE